MSRLDEIEEYVSKATEGPWSFEEGEDEEGNMRWFVGFERHSEFGFWVADSSDPNPADTHFIANIRTDAPLLLEVARAVAKARDTWELTGHMAWEPVLEALAALENK